MGKFAGKTAVVTGASRGIGLGIAERLVAEGARLVVTARKAEALEAAVTKLGGPQHAVGIAGNGADFEHHAQIIERAMSSFGSVDLLVNNTGINPVFGPMIELDMVAARKIVETNCLAAISLVQQAYRAWMKEHGGSVINVSSIAGLRPAPGIGFYGSSKAMLAQITQQLALELAPKIRVNAVAPAVVKTRFASALYEGKEEAVTATYPLARLGAPADVAGAVSFLLSDDASWVTGQTVVLDGGLLLRGGV